MRFSNFHLLASLLFLGLFISCSPKVSTSIQSRRAPLKHTDEIIVLSIGRPVPENAENLGLIKIGDSGFSIDCGYEVVVNAAIIEARNAGGNVLKIIEHNPPDSYSTCHRMKFLILKMDNTEILFDKEAQVRAEEERNDKDYALLHIYRPSGLGPLISYNLNIEDSLICRVKNNYRTRFKFYDEGKFRIWAKTESRAETIINIEKGKEYYIRCEVVMGAFVGRPLITVVDKYYGSLEYNSLKGDEDVHDYIFRTNGQKIACRIIDEDDETVYFIIWRKKEKIKTQLSKDQIEGIEYFD